MGAVMRAHPWAASPLGEPDGWPQPLKTLVGVMLAAEQPMFVAWGANRTLLYNDAYAPMLADRHPAAFGRPFMAVWADAERELTPLFDRVFAGEPVHMGDLALQLNRAGRPPEAHFAFSYTPVRDESGDVVGLFCPCTETTDQVLAERRRAAEAQRQLAVFQQMPGFVAVLTGPDHVFEYVNDAYVAVAGARDYLGRSVREVMPDLAGQGFFELLDQVYATGEPFAARASPIDLVGESQPRYLDFLYQPIRTAAGQVTGIFVGGYDITERVRAEQRREALLQLDERLRNLSDTAALSFAASELLGETLGAVRVGYGTVDPDARTITVERNWSAPGFGSVAGVHDFTDYGVYIDDLRRGEAVANNAVRLDPRTAANVASFDDLHVAAFLDVPVVEHGRLTSQMFVHSATPRIWAEEEVSLTRDFAERTRAAIARRTAEEELRASEARLRAVIDAAPVGLVFANAEGRITGGNARVEEILRHPVLPSANVDAYGEWVSHHADGRRVQGREYPLGQVLAGKERAELEVLYQRGDGREAWVRFVAAPVRDPGGRTVGGVVASIDIDRERRTEAQLRELNADLERQVAERSLARGITWQVSPDLFGVLNADARFEQSNPAWKSVLGWSEAEIGERPFLEFVHPDDLARTEQAWADAIERGQPALRFENRYRTKAGAWCWLSWVAVPDGGKVYCSARDITEDKAREAELEAAQEQLRQSQKMEAVGQLTGGLAHDFNNLLAGIAGSLELIRMRMAQGRTAEVERYVTAAQGAANRAASLTHRLLAFSRRQTLAPKPTDVKQLITGMLDLISRTVGPQVRLETVNAVGLWPSLIDPSQLENAILNLCINARDAMPDGGTITIETGNRWLDARTAQARGLEPGQYISLCVSDTGTGMTPDVIAKAFDPFFTTKPIGVGTGLGLSMIYGFAKQSGGAVLIYSEVDQGATVCIYLPRHLGETETAEVTTELADAPRGEGETVLVIDDEPTVRMLVTEVLADLGYRAIEADDGATGLKVLNSDVRIDLLVTDVGLPGGVNGRQVADAARAVRPELKVLFITGYAENAVLSHGHLDPGMHVMTKPFAMEALATRIRALIGG